MLSIFRRKIKAAYKWRSWHAYVLLVVVIVTVYAQSLFFDYSYLDDQQLIIEHADILERANPGEIFLNDVFFSSSKYYYRPLLTWSFVLDWHWGNTSVFAFHFSNLIFHIIAVCLLFYLLRMIGIKEKMALILSLIFSIHPALSQAVAWIPGRNDVMVSVLVFSTLIFWSRWLRREKLFDLIFLWLFFAASLLTKETAALLPLFALVWIFVFERHNFTWLKFIYAASGAATIFFIWVLLRVTALGGLETGTVWQSFGHNILSPLIFLGKAILPVNLSVYPVLADSVWLFGVISFGGLMLLLYYSRPLRWKRLLFGFAWFWLFLVLGSIRPDNDLFRNFMEHRLYLPIFGVLIILAETENFWKKRSLSFRYYFLAAIFITFIVINLVHTRSFQNRLSFWHQAVASSPHSPLAQRNLGAMYYLDGDLNLAEMRFRQALQLNPQEVMAHNNLAAIYIDRGDLWRGEIELKKELEINPNYDIALFNLGRIYYLREQYQEAMVLWQRALKVNPYNKEVEFYLQELSNKLKTENFHLNK
ncbi:tetratricopeptide repeat protein [Patescibacteria group bacterium]|nr:tetratricopeptide repeat protein [Patescibacteria group bacterium]